MKRILAALIIATLSAPTASALSSQIVVPNEVHQLARDVGVPLPPFIAPQVDPLQQELRAATVSHLTKQGHREDPAAGEFARQWADQAARGEVEFISNVGDGTTGLDRGEGNVYRLTRQEAAERVAWLNRDVPVNTSPRNTGFGVATSTDGTHVYVAEYFLH